MSVTTIAALIVMLTVVYFFVTDEKRTRAHKFLTVLFRDITAYARQELAMSVAVLRERPVPSVTPALIAINVTLFVFMVFGSGSLSDPATMIRWGGSVGPKTSNGEWWRLATAPFVHSGFIALMVNAIAIVQVGLLLERAVGGFAVWTTYASAAMLSSVANLWGRPLSVATGASGAVCGLYGLFLALILTDRNAGSDARISLVAVRRVLPMAALVLLFNMANGGVGIAGEAMGVVAGLALGLTVVRPVPNGTPSRRRIGVGLAVAFVIAVVLAAPLRGITDVRPEIQRLFDLEQQTAGTYQAAYGTREKRRTDADALVQLIEQRIVPALQEADRRIKSLRGVPSHDQWRMDNAVEYLRLRTQSWSLRAQGLREASAPLRPITKQNSPAITMSSGEAAARYRSSLLKLGGAEAAERTALQVLDRLKA